MTMKMVTLRIDEHTVEVPAGTLVVDAAKMVGVDIPVFCYHPKMEAVGMCRMCLVEIGRPVVDRASGKVLLEEDGSPRIQMSPKLDTACTTPVSEGMLVVTTSEKVAAARREVIEFILTSHPLDCPICDKGGECPLQNLTMAYGPGTSRFIFDDKMRMAKHVPLGELIYLDRERCIQCGRCVRFQHEVVDDPVLDFYQRGRALEIITRSEPGFDSIFSGNTTDICPVGALTTADFRFGARPWEMKPAASICAQCPVGCNIVYDVRREAKSGGKPVIKRIMPRQNEAVNEIWMCDKGRFVHHFNESAERLTQPLMRAYGELVPVSWEQALDLAAEKIKSAAKGLVTLAGGRLANEDLFNLRELTRAQDGAALLHSPMGGGEWTRQLGLSHGSNLGSLGKGDAILVVASDLHQEAPLWWLRLKQAAQRGANLIVLNTRPTRLDGYAAHALRCDPGEEAASVSKLSGTHKVPAAFKAARDALAAASNLVVFFGSDGLGLTGTRAVAQACADLLVQSGHYGRPDNGLVAVWQHANDQGAWEMGYAPAADLAGSLKKASVALVAAADPLGDDPSLAKALESADYLIVQEMFLTATAEKADLVLPAAAPAEREGSLTSGERRVQRCYPAVPAPVGPLPDFAIAAQIASRLGLDLEGRAAGLVFQRLADSEPAFAGLSYQAISTVEAQYPIVGRHDLYYGGTTYDNNQGMGAHLQPGLKPGEKPTPAAAAAHTLPADKDSLLVLPHTVLYDQGSLIRFSRLLVARVASAELRLNPSTARRFGLADGEQAVLNLNGSDYRVSVRLDADLPPGAGWLPRRVGVPLWAPSAAQIKVLERD